MTAASVACGSPSKSGVSQRIVAISRTKTTSPLSGLRTPAPSATELRRGSRRSGIPARSRRGCSRRRARSAPGSGRPRSRGAGRASGRRRSTRRRRPGRARARRRSTRPMFLRPTCGSAREGRRRGQVHHDRDSLLLGQVERPARGDAGRRRRAARQEAPRRSAGAGPSPPSPASPIATGRHSCRRAGWTIVQAFSNVLPLPAGHAQHLRELRDDHVDRDAGDEADEHGAGDEVGDEAEPHDARSEHRDPRAERERREQRGLLLRSHRGGADDRGRRHRRRAARADRELPACSEDRVQEHRRARRVEPGLRRRARERGIRDRLRHQHRPDRQPREGVEPKPPPRTPAANGRSVRTWRWPRARARGITGGVERPESDSAQPDPDSRVSICDGLPRNSRPWFASRVQVGEGSAYSASVSNATGHPLLAVGGLGTAVSPDELSAFAGDLAARVRWCRGAERAARSPRIRRGCAPRGRDRRAALPTGRRGCGAGGRDAGAGDAPAAGAGRVAADVR